MSEPREFSLDEANALVPTLHRLMRLQMLRQQHLEESLAELHELTGQLPRELAVLVDDSPDVVSLKTEISDLMEEVDRGWSEVHALGGVVKDPRIGLIDFYGRLDGRQVFFCWRFGEESISHYHEIDEGFGGRKPLPQVARHRLLN